MMPGMNPGGRRCVRLLFSLRAGMFLLRDLLLLFQLFLLGRFFGHNGSRTIASTVAKSLREFNRNGNKKDPATRGLSKVQRERNLFLLLLCGLFSLFLWCRLLGLFNDLLGSFFLLHHGRKC